MKSGRAFTLIEVLVVLTIMGLVFSVLILVFSRGIDSSLNITQKSEDLKRKAVLFWDLQRKVFGAKEIKIDPKGIYMLTSAGSFNKGVVKCAYIFKDKKLYYYEFPYLLGALDEVDEDKLIEVGRFSRFEVTAWDGRRELRVFDGLPQLVKVYLDDEEFVFEVFR